MCLEGVVLPRGHVEVIKAFSDVLGAPILLVGGGDYRVQLVAAQLEQATRLAVARNDATIDECETETRYSGRSGKRLTGYTRESPRAAKRPSGPPRAH